MLITVTDITGHDAPVTIDHSDFATTISTWWHPEVSDKILTDIFEVELALGRGEDVSDLCDFLSLTVSKH